MEKISKEMNDIIKAIEAYHKKYNGDVGFCANFFAFNKKGDVVDDRIFVYGVKEAILITMEELIKEIKKDKEEFINY